MIELVLATGNRHKVEEIRHIVDGMPFRIRALSEFPDVPDVVEDGSTLQENAIKKARTIALHVRHWALADDTGLEVDALNGEPGVYSARWAGPGCTYEDNNRKLLSALAGKPEAQRAAQFRCVIAVSSPTGEVWTAEGSIRGCITSALRGIQGFGYDPVFLVPDVGKTFAELPAEIKNRISHRARALAGAQEILEQLRSAGRFS